MSKFRKTVSASRSELRAIFPHINRFDLIVEADIESRGLDFGGRFGDTITDPVFSATFLSEESYNAFILMRD